MVRDGTMAVYVCSKAATTAGEEPRVRISTRIANLLEEQDSKVPKGIAAIVLLAFYVATSAKEALVASPTVVAEKVTRDRSTTFAILAIVGRI